MSFMQPEIVFGSWIEVDGPCGTEFIDADLVGQVEEYHGTGTAITISEPLATYCENTIATEIKLVRGYGARFSAPGYLDRTEWAVFQSQAEAEEYLAEQGADDE
jgi:hypothetical protein